MAEFYPTLIDYGSFHSVSSKFPAAADAAATR
jgi:hypothetical protein